MMRLIDTHCHLDFPDYANDIDAVIKRAEGAGVIRMIIPGTNVESSKAAVSLAAKYENIYAAVGIHPHEADRVDSNAIFKLKDIAASSDKVVAIGEIGLDYYRNYAKPDNQKALFRSAIKTAKELDLPVIVHNRNAGTDLLYLLEEAQVKERGGVVHCFSGEKDMLGEFLALGMYISFAGNITFEKAESLREIISSLPPERLLLETDSPYITPHPLRGERNEPANVRYLLKVYAEIFDLSEDDIARITTHNANELFRLGIEEKGEIVYPIRDSLYLNITNRCTNACAFCTREKSNYVKGHNLRLDREPTVEEIKKKLGDISGYKEIVFCGYGEPTIRLDVVKDVASFAKKKGVKVRLVTNGEGNLINSRHIAGELKGLIDKVSVSLNAPDAAGYDKLCRSVFGAEGYKAVMEFIGDCVKNGIEAEVTCLDILSDEDLKRCEKAAKDLGASFRLRYLDTVG